MGATDAIITLKPQCQVVMFPWNQETLKESGQEWADLIHSTPLDISAELEQVSFDKDLSGAAGSFSISLPATQDWKKVIKPGHWGLIYMSNDGDLKIPTDSKGQGSSNVKLSDLKAQGDRLRGICYVERVGVRGNVEANGVNEISFEISGRDFGVVYEGTEIWQNFFLFESAIIDAAVTSLQARGARTIDALLETIHDLFYTPSAYPNILNQDPKNRARNTLSQVGFQWLLPKEMVEALGMSLRPGKTLPFWGHLDQVLQFGSTKATYPIENPMATLNGNAWEKLKSYSLQQLHELFTEIDEDGTPSLTFRCIPWKLNATGYPRLSQFIKSMVDLWNDGNQLTIESSFILDFDLGEDSHNRYNHFYLAPQTADYHPNDSISELLYPSKAGRTFPYAQLNSIARHGFKPFHTEVNAMIQLGINADAKSDQGILVEYNELMYDYWNPAIFLESGTLTVFGDPTIKVGRVVKIGSDAPYNGDKLFYIEGYSDHFTVEGENGSAEWVQTLKVTRGAPLDAYRNALGLGADSDTRFSSKKDTFAERASFTRKK